jgi:hypothetical protein
MLRSHRYFGAAGVVFNEPRSAPLFIEVTNRFNASPYRARASRPARKHAQRKRGSAQP